MKTILTWVFKARLWMIRIELKWMLKRAETLKHLGEELATILRRDGQ